MLVGAGAMRRESAAARGYDYHWRSVVRPRQLAKEPLCRFCEEKRRVVPATEVDHIDGNSRNNDPDNLRSLCHDCHSGRTARDQGFASHAAPYPKGLKRPTAEVILVAGPPSGGKSTYIQEHCTPKDVIVDWDQISQMVAGVRTCQLPPNRYSQVVIARNRILEQLHTVPGKDRIFIEDRAPLLWQRRHWVSMFSARVVVLETAPEVCIARVARDASSAGRPGPRAAPELWWEQYAVDYADERIRS